MLGVDPAIEDRQFYNHHLNKYIDTIKCYLQGVTALSGRKRIFYLTTPLYSLNPDNGFSDPESFSFFDQNLNVFYRYSRSSLGLEPNYQFNFTCMSMCMYVLKCNNLCYHTDCLWNFPSKNECISISTLNLLPQGSNLHLLGLLHILAKQILYYCTHQEAKFHFTYFSICYVNEILGKRYVY